MNMQVDTYGVPVKDPNRRHPKCTCKVPCQARYSCEGLAHVGRRATPWCSGGSDSDECDDCWVERHCPRAA